MPQPTMHPFGSFNQSQWGPDAIGTIFFGIVMFFIGVIALWQGRLRRLKHEEGTSGSVYLLFSKAANTIQMRSKAEGPGLSTHQSSSQMKALWWIILRE